MAWGGAPVTQPYPRLHAHSLDRTGNTDMATYTLSPALRLRLDSNLTANARYNLLKLDLLAATFVVDTTDTLRIRSITDIVIEPESADLGGSGVGGNLSLGTDNHSLARVDLYADLITASVPLSLRDQGTEGIRYLRIGYNSSLSDGTVDIDADRVLSIDVVGADRELVLGGDLATSGGGISLATTTGEDAAVTLPITGTLATLAGTETLTGKSIDAEQNTLTNLRSSSLAADAGVTYSQLDLSGSIKASDVAADAAIPYTALELTGTLLGSDIRPDADIPRSTLAPGTPGWIAVNAAGTGVLSEAEFLTPAQGGTGANLSGVTFPTTGLILSTDNPATVQNKNISGIDNTLTDIPYASLDLTASVTDADLAPGTPGHVRINDGTTGAPTTEAALAKVRGGTGADNSAVTFPATGVIPVLPADAPVTGQLLVAADTSGNLGWFTVEGTGTVTSVDVTVPAALLEVTGGPVTTTGTLAISLAEQAAGTILAGPVSGANAAPTFRALDLDDLPADIPTSGLAALTVDRALQTGATGLLEVSAVSSTELGYLSGVTSALQGQLDGKQDEDATLTALAAYATDGFLVQTAADTFVGREIEVGTGLSVTAGDGVAGNPTISLTTAGYVETWIAAVGVEKVVTHNLGTKDVLVQVYDIDTGATVLLDNTVRTSDDVVTLTSSQAPTGTGLRVLIRMI